MAELSHIDFNGEILEIADEAARKDIAELQESQGEDLAAHETKIGDETTSGHVKLSDLATATYGVSDGYAATPQAVKKAYDKAETAESAAETAQSTAETAQSTAETATNIAKGRNQALSYPTYQKMVEGLNTMKADELNVGQNIYIGSTGVPDLWVYGVVASQAQYTYVSDAAIIAAIEANVKLQIGYYYVSFLETQKVDLTDIEAEIDANTTAINSLQADLTEAETEIDANVTAIDALNNILKSAGINSNLLGDNLIPSNISFADLIAKKTVTFFANTTDSTNFPVTHGSGVMMPLADSRFRLIYYQATCKIYAGYVTVSTGTVTWRRMFDNETGVATLLAPGYDTLQAFVEATATGAAMAWGFRFKDSVGWTPYAGWWRCWVQYQNTYSNTSYGVAGSILIMGNKGDIYNGFIDGNSTKGYTVEWKRIAITDGTDIQFGVDENGNYGYIKEGADTVTPFKQGAECIYIGTSTSVQRTETVNLSRYTDYKSLTVDNFIVDFQTDPRSINTSNGSTISPGTTLYASMSLGSVGMDYDESTGILTITTYPSSLRIWDSSGVINKTQKIDSSVHIYINH